MKLSFSTPLALSRFDRAVWLTLLGAVAAVAGMLWQSGNWVLGDPPSGILYIAWDETGRNRLFLIDPKSGDVPLPITDETADVADFAVSPDGRTVVYTRRRADGLGDLWLVGTNGRLSRPSSTATRSAAAATHSANVGGHRGTNGRYPSAVPHLCRR